MGKGHRSGSGACSDIKQREDEVRNFYVNPSKILGRVWQGDEGTSIYNRPCSKEQASNPRLLQRAGKAVEMTSLL